MYNNKYGVYSDHALAKQTCWKQFACFKTDDFELKDKERPDLSKKFKDKELEASLNEDSYHTLQELSTSCIIGNRLIDGRNTSQNISYNP